MPLPTPTILYKRVLSPSPRCWGEGLVKAKEENPQHGPSRALKCSCITGHRRGGEKTGSRRWWEHNPIKGGGGRFLQMLPVSDVLRAFLPVLTKRAEKEGEAGTGWGEGGAPTGKM